MPTETIGGRTGSTYNGIADTFINSGAATTNYGSADTQYIDDDRRLLLNATGLSNITGPVTVSAASLLLYVEEQFNAGTYSLYRLLVPWVEAQATWNIRSTGNNWGTAGASGAGDRSATLTASASVPSGSAYPYGDVTFSGAQLDADVQDMINNPSTNYGWAIVKTSASGYTEFGVTSNTHPTAANRPQLSVTWTAAASYSLTADVGAYTYTGVDAYRDISMAAEAGSYAKTGIDALFARGYALSADGTTFTYTGRDVTLAYSGQTGYPPVVQRGVLNVYQVSASGRTKWINYLPVKFDPSATSNRYDNNGAIAVNEISDTTGLVEWVDYFPIVVVGDDATGRWRRDNAGWLPIKQV